MTSDIDRLCEEIAKVKIQKGHMEQTLASMTNKNDVLAMARIVNYQEPVGLTPEETGQSRA